MNGDGVTHSVDVVFHNRTSNKFGSRGSTALWGHSYGAGAGVFDKLWTLDHGDVIKYASHGETYVGRVGTVRKIKPRASIASCYDLRGEPRACIVTCDERTRTADGVYKGKTLVTVTGIHRRR